MENIFGLVLGHLAIGFVAGVGCSWVYAHMKKAYLKYKK